MSCHRPNKIGRANGEEPFTFIVFGGRDRRLIPSLTSDVRRQSQSHPHESIALLSQICFVDSRRLHTLFAHRARHCRHSTVWREGVLSLSDLGPHISSDFVSFSPVRVRCNLACPESIFVACYHGQRDACRSCWVPAYACCSIC